MFVFSADVVILAALVIILYICIGVFFYGLCFVLPKKGEYCYRDDMKDATTHRIDTSATLITMLKSEYKMVSCSYENKSNLYKKKV